VGVVFLLISRLLYSRIPAYSTYCDSSLQRLLLCVDRWIACSACVVVCSQVREGYRLEETADEAGQHACVCYRRWEMENNADETLCVCMHACLCVCRYGVDQCEELLKDESAFKALLKDAIKGSPVSTNSINMLYSLSYLYGPCRD